VRRQPPSPSPPPRDVLQQLVDGTQFAALQVEQAALAAQRRGLRGDDVEVADGADAVLLLRDPTSQGSSK
jgi:hypothetical protein